MKKRILAMLLLCLLAACQPTPEEDVVFNKAEGKLEELISATAVPDYVASAPDEAGHETLIRQAITAPERVQEQFDGQAVGAHLYVEIDAAVDVPNVAKIPVLRGHIITELSTEAERLAKLLLGDGPYVVPGYDRSVQAKKEMENFQAWIDALEQKPYGENADYDGLRAGLQQNLESASVLISQPTEYDYNADVPWDGSFSDLKDSVSLGNGKTTFSFSAGQVFLYRTNEYGLSLSWGDVIRGPRTEEEQTALNSAVAFASSLGFTETVPQSINASDELTRLINNSDTGFENGYQSFTLLPVYAGVPLYPYTTNYGSDTGRQAAGVHYDTDFRQEEIFGAAYRGKVVNLQWFYPFRVTGTENENVSLLPFTEIMEIFRRQVFMNQYLDSGDDKTLYITDIRLSYMRVKIRDSDEYYLLPVWDFLGYDEHAWHHETDPGKLALTHSAWNNQSILTINAIDGSILDRNLGY